MAHPGSAITNGATLEDCHTNIFVLTELNGLKWCRFSAPTSHSNVVTDVRDDPILCAYSRCLSQSLLCVWRRAPPNASFNSTDNHSDFRLSAEKELQVFWYGEEPDWKQLCTDSLKRICEGAWDTTTGVEYDTRTLLFKALHNLIERCLLTRSFVRIGRWFVKPLGFDDINDSSANAQVLAFSFSFFVHGENNVCVCVNVQQQPPVYRLPPSSFFGGGESSNINGRSRVFNEIGGKRSVLLAPWSLKGCLNLDDLNQPVDEETCAKKSETFREWARFYPLLTNPVADWAGGNDLNHSADSADADREEERQSNERAIPPVVEVTVGGVRVQYPSCFVLLLSEDAEKNWPCSSSASSSSTSTVALSRRRQFPVNNNDISSAARLKFDATKFQHRLVERVLEENTLAQKRSTISSVATSAPTGSETVEDHSSLPPSATSALTAVSVWDFTAEPLAGGAPASSCAQKDAPNCTSSCQCSWLQTTSATSNCSTATTSQVLNKAQLKFGLTSSMAISSAANCGGPGGRLRMERQARLIKCGVFHRRSTAAAPNMAAADSAGALTVGTSYGGSGAMDPRVAADSPFSRPASRPPPISLNTVSATTAPTSSSIQMISPVSSVTVVTAGEPTGGALVAQQDKINNAAHPEQPPRLQKSNFKAFSFMANDEYVQTKGSDGAEIYVLKHNLSTANKNNSRKVTGPPLLFNIRRKRKKIDSATNFQSSTIATDDSVDCNPFYPSISSDDCTNLSKKFRLWSERPSFTESVAPVLIKNDLEAYPNRTPSPSPFVSVSRAFQQSPNNNTFSLGESCNIDSLQQPEPIQSVHSMTASSVYNNASDKPVYQTAPTHGYAAAYLPDNIMADSSSNSDTDDDNTFLSPPPSHGQEEETSGRKVKPLFSTVSNSVSHSTTSALFSSSQPALDQQPSQKRASSMNCSNSCPPAVLDYGMIYPTPPSVDGTTQFSPESATSSWHECHSHLGGIIATSNRQLATSSRAAAPSSGAPSSFSFHSNSTEPLELANKSGAAGSLSLGHVAENPASAKYLSAPKFGPFQALPSQQSLTTSCAKLVEYKPKYSSMHNHVARQPFPLSTLNFSPPFISQCFLSPPRVIQQQSSFCPPPPYPVCRPLAPNCSGGAPFSSPPLSQPLRSFMAEQSPMTILNSPLNSHLARTPRTPGAPDLQSPLSNASSHYGRNIGSIELGATGSSVYAGFVPEAHSLSLSLLLCDTFMDLHRDVVFDACPLCVCSMNMQGSEMGLYVNSNNAGFLDPHNQCYSVAKCLCGFSAVRNRYLSYKSGQFYEDEYDATGIWRCRQSAADDLNSNNIQSNSEIIELIRHQTLSVDLTKSVSVAQLLYRKNQAHNTNNMNNSTSNSNNALLAPSASSLIQRYNWSELELDDFAELCNISLEQACLIGDCTTPTRDDLTKSKSSLVHSWGFLRSKKPLSILDAMSVIRNLLPMLQESVQKPRGVWQSKHSVEGPLTWRQFHRKCYHRVGNTGREDLSCGPEPVPLLLASFEREWVTLSPFSLHFWDRLSLEPFGQTKDVAYVVVVPDSQDIVQKARLFFRELSKVYEGLRLGRHCPISRVLKDGIMRVGKASAGHLSNKMVDQWFDKFEHHANNELKAMSSMVSRIKLYAQVCRHYLAPYLAENAFDRAIFREAAAKENAALAATLSAPADSTMPPPPAPSPSGFNAESSDTAYADSLNNDSPDNEGPPIPHAVVVYLVNSFTYGAENEDEDQNRMSTTALFRCYLEILKDLPDLAKSNIQMQIIPLQTVLDFTLPDESKFSSRSSKISDTVSLPQQLRPVLTQSEYFRQLALNVFAQSRTVGMQCLLSLQAKPLTAVGPAASKIEFIKKKLEKMPNASFQMHCPLVILAPLTENLTANHSAGGAFAGCGAVTTSGAQTAGGSSSTSNSNNINSGELKDISARVLFLTYCLSEKQRWLLAAATDHQGALVENCVINIGVPNRWCASRRAVIGEALKKLWDFACGLMATGTQQWRLVIGRLGRLGHDELKVWAHLLSKAQLKATSKSFRDHCGVCHAIFGGSHEIPFLLSACLISTEADANFRVFPDSFVYDERFGQNAKQCPLSTPEDVSCTHIMVFPTSALIQMHQGGAVSMNCMGQNDDMDNFDFFDIISSIPTADEEVDRLVDQNSLMPETLDDSIQQQPLALGYIISTAPISFAPEFLWSYCPSAKYTNPVHLRSSLHINTSRVHENDDVNGKTIYTNPLDSSLTTDVLRYVLETYNALSWLSVDAISGDRRSCLPIHMQALCRLYKSMEKLL